MCKRMKSNICMLRDRRLAHKQQNKHAAALEEWRGIVIATALQYFTVWFSPSSISLFGIHQFCINEDTEVGASQNRDKIRNSNAMGRRVKHETIHDG